jgi:Family of unknown function (DUF6527)
MKIKAWKSSDGSEGFTYWCQGCNDRHSVRAVRASGGALWGFNGNHEKPTFTPSVMIRSGRAVDPTYEPQPDDPPEVCHTFITDGMVQFLSDCTHELAGLTLPLPDLPRGDNA